MPWRRFLHVLGPALGLAIFAAALWVLHHELKEYHLRDIVRDIKAIPAGHILLACVLTVASYAVLTGYDTLALRYVGRPLAYRRVALASFLGYAFSNNIGLSVVSGGSVRYRLYSGWGLSAIDVTKIVGFCGVTFWLGFLTVAGAIFAVHPPGIPAKLHLPFGTTRPLGILFLALIAGYISLIVLRKRPITVRGWELHLPTIRISLGQIAVASLDWILAAGVLYSLLPASQHLSYPGFLGIYLLAQVAGIASQVPGGLGVFETLILVMLPEDVPSSAALGALLAYRGIYYLLPLTGAAVLLGTREFLEKREGVERAARVFGQWAPALVPHILAFTTFVGGAVLLFSGATPAADSRLAGVGNLLPLPAIELSHFLASLMGVGLLLLARGLQRRLDIAYHLAVILLGFGVLFSLLKGLDYPEAIVLGLMLIALLPCHHRFYRKGALLSERFTPGWTTAVALVLLAAGWLGFFSFKHVEYSGDLWWRFTLFGHAPRFFRAAVGVVGVVLLFAMARLLRAARPKPAVFYTADMETIRAIVKSASRTYASFALLGDKTFLLNPEKNAFLMYGVEGRSWVVLGDPVGPEEEHVELIWQFRERCDRYDGWPVFYQVPPATLHIYSDMGFTALKLGEEGRVPLPTFSLEGPARKGLRYTRNKLAREGCSFELIPHDQVPPFLPELKAISDAWLAEKNTREKGFSLGFFDERYLREFSMAVVHREGRIIAFANVLSTVSKEELSLDLMRHLPDAPHSVMEYLFIELMLWGRQEGYGWFTLGMAPLSGLEDHPLAPPWNRVGSIVFRYGEHFYGFQGLRQYKEKFDPVWEPRYLASPGGLALPRILTSIASLTAGGLRGVIGK